MVVEDAVRRKPALKPKSKRHKQKTARVKRNQKWICGHVWWNSDFITATLQGCILTRQTKGMNSARQIMEQLFHYGHFVVMHMDKINKGDEQRSTDHGIVISLRPLCSDAYGQGKQRGWTTLDRRHKPYKGDNPDLNRLLWLSPGIRANTR